MLRDGISIVSVTTLPHIRLVPTSAQLRYNSDTPPIIIGVVTEESRGSAGEAQKLVRNGYREGIETARGGVEGRGQDIEMYIEVNITMYNNREKAAHPTL